MVTVFLSIVGTIHPMVTVFLSLQSLPRHTIGHWLSISVKCIRAHRLEPSQDLVSLHLHSMPNSIPMRLELQNLQEGALRLLMATLQYRPLYCWYMTMRHIY